MIFNYIKLAYRNFIKYKFISFINLLGLTIGLACCFLIGIYILHELSFDKYNPEAKRIYRITRSFNNPETGAINLNLGTVAPPFGYYLPTDFPEIEKITRLIDNSPAPVRYGEKKFNEQSVYFADENLFDFFKVDMIAGNPKKALSDPFSVMLTPEVAKKYFGNEEPMNKVLRMNNQFDLKVTGIYQPFPSNAHLHPAMMISFNTLNDTAVYGAENLLTNWGNNSFLTYLLLPEKYDIKKMEARFPAFLDKHMTQNGNSKFKTSQGTSLALQKLTDIHLRSHLD
ncbi:MAG TPA: ABC transporter permease, partial [Chitinophagaceae bacterium]|nr:ABC transporter permease [Chitinophagaceae bacterium]